MSIDKTELLQRIGQVFVERGYDGATLVHLAQATGLSKATLYHHFPEGKTEMAAVLVRDAISRLQKNAFRHFQTHPAEAAWTLFFEGFSHYVDGGKSNCMLAVLVNQSTAHGEIAELKQLIHEQFADWHSTLATAFESQGLKPKKARRAAYETLAQIYGALMVSKLYNNDKLFAKTITRLSSSNGRNQHA